MSVEESRTVGTSESEITISKLKLPFVSVVPEKRYGVPWDPPDSESKKLISRSTGPSLGLPSEFTIRPE